MSEPSPPDLLRLMISAKTKSAGQFLWLADLHADPHPSIAMTFTEIAQDDRASATELESLFRVFYHHTSVTYPTINDVLHAFSRECNKTECLSHFMENLCCGINHKTDNLHLFHYALASVTEISLKKIILRMIREEEDHRRTLLALTPPASTPKTDPPQCNFCPWFKGARAP